MNKEMKSLQRDEKEDEEEKNKLDGWCYGGRRVVVMMIEEE